MRLINTELSEKKKKKISGWTVTNKADCIISFGPNELLLDAQEWQTIRRPNLIVQPLEQLAEKRKKTTMKKAVSTRNWTVQEAKWELT